MRPFRTVKNKIDVLRRRKKQEHRNRWRFSICAHTHTHIMFSMKKTKNARKIKLLLCDFSQRACVHLSHSHFTRTNGNQNRREKRITLIYFCPTTTYATVHFLVREYFEGTTRYNTLYKCCSRLRSRTNRWYIYSVEQIQRISRISHTLSLYLSLSVCDGCAYKLMPTTVLVRLTAQSTQWRVSTAKRRWAVWAERKQRRQRRKITTKL